MKRLTIGVGGRVGAWRWWLRWTKGWVVQVGPLEEWCGEEMLDLAVGFKVWLGFFALDVYRIEPFREEVQS